MENHTRISYGEKETIALGEEFAKTLVAGDVVAFYGELGSGKTEFIKGICHTFSVEEMVTSPTFTIINQYNGSLNNDDIVLFHIDLYRINKPSELSGIGIFELLARQDSIILIEWAERTPIIKNSANYIVSIGIDAENENIRHINIEKHQ